MNKTEAELKRDNDVAREEWASCPDPGVSGLSEAERGERRDRKDAAKKKWEAASRAWEKSLRGWYW